MTKKDAYRIVYNDIANRGINLFFGKYDAINGSESFMHGISMVMEFIAYNVSEAQYEDFNKIFIENMIKSEERRKNKW